MPPSEPIKRPLTLREHDNARHRAWQEHNAEFECQHQSTDVRKRAVAGGAWQLVRQCLDCGARVGGAMSQAGIDMAEVGAFEESLLTDNTERRAAAAAVIRAEFDRDKWFDSYTPYLSSPAWAKRRRQVLERAKGSCEGCGENPPTEVHHLTYAHVGNEFLFELVALCASCHDRIHADGDA